VSIETSTKNITVDLADFGRYQNTVTVMQGDNGTRFARVTVLNDGHPFDLTGVFPVLRGTKSDGTTVFNECTVVDNKVMVELTQNILTVAGMGRYEIALYSNTPTPGSDSNQVISAFPFTIHVVKSSFDAVNMESSNEWTVLEEAMQNIPLMSELDDYIETVNGYEDRISTLEGEVDGHTIRSDVPANAVFTDTTYSPATTSTDGLMSSSDKAKMNAIESGAEVNQNAFSSIIVGEDTVTAGSKTASLTFTGEGVSVGTNNEIVFDGGGSGVEEDLIKLDSVETYDSSSQNYTSMIEIYRTNPDEDYYANKLKDIMYDVALDCSIETCKTILDKWTEQYNLNHYSYMVFGGDENPCIGFATATEGTEGESGQLFDGYCYAEFNYDDETSEWVLVDTWHTGESTTFEYGYYNFGTYDGFFDAPEGVDYRPVADSYVSNLVVEVSQDSEESPTAETFVPIYKYANFYLNQGYYVGSDQTNIESMYLPFDSLGSFSKKCPNDIYDGDEYSSYYKYYYYLITTPGNPSGHIFEIWSNFPLIYATNTMTNGSFVFYDHYNSELKYNAAEDLYKSDFAIYENGNYITSLSSPLSNYFYSGSSLSNIIFDSSCHYDSSEQAYTTSYETEIIDFLDNQWNLKNNYEYGYSYGMIYDYRNGIAYEKYLVIPQWCGFDMSYCSSAFESCITHPDTTPSIGDFVVYKYKNPMKICTDDVVNPAKQKIYKQIGNLITYYDTLHGYYVDFDSTKNIIVKHTDIPEGCIGVSNFSIGMSNFDDSFNIKIHVEYSKNSLVYQKDIVDEEVTDTDIYDALGYHPVPEEGFYDNLTDFLGTKKNGINAHIYYSDNYNYDIIPYQYYTVEGQGLYLSVYSKQYLLNMQMKLFPVMYNDDSSNSYIYGIPRVDNIGLRFYNGRYNSAYVAVLSPYETRAMVKKCKYNNKYYKYTYVLRNAYNVNVQYEIFSNYVLVALENQYLYSGDIYYLTPGGNPSSDQLTKLMAIPESDNDYYVQYTVYNGSNITSSSRLTGDISSGLSGWPTNNNRYYYGTNMLWFSESSINKAKAYASYFCDHSNAATGRPTVSPEYTDTDVFLNGTININSKEYYSIDFMEEYDNSIIDLTSTYMLPETSQAKTRYWYQYQLSNDPDSEYYQENAQPVVGKAIAYTRTYEVPYNINGSDPNYPIDIYNSSWSQKDFYVNYSNHGIYLWTYMNMNSNPNRLRSRYMKNLITFDCSIGRYATLNETTDIRSDIYELKDMIISSLNGSY